MIVNIAFHMMFSHILTFSLGFMSRNALPINILPTDNATNKLKIHFIILLSSFWFAYYAILQKVIQLPFDLHFFYYCDKYFSLLLTRTSYSSSFMVFYLNHYNTFLIELSQNQFFFYFRILLHWNQWLFNTYTELSRHLRWV